MEDLRGRHVVVTGATGPLGNAVCAAVLASGATVTAVARRRTALDQLRADLRNHDRLHVAEGDVSDGPSVERLFDALERGTGPIDAVVHTVGGFHWAPLIDTTDETLDALDRALFRSPVLVTRAALRRMLPRNRGRIVLTGGMASTRPSANMAVYGALKAAVAHFVQSMTSETRDSDVTVNAVLPGVIDTVENRHSAPGADPSRWVPPAQIASVICTLLGDPGGSIRGALLTIPDRTT